MTDTASKAWAPANISLVFTIEDNPDPSKKGSRGVGFTLDKGVTATITASAKTELFWNGELIDFPTVTAVIKKLTSVPISVKLESALPLGCGFGLSGASALATAYAINDHLQLGKTDLELAKIAHTADVVNHTGLGDVGNQYTGGFCVKHVVSSAFIVERLPFDGTPIFYNGYGPWISKDLLTDEEKKKNINTAGNLVLTHIKKNNNPTLNDILRWSYIYAKDAGLIVDQKVEDTLGDIYAKGNTGSMILIGKGVVSDKPFAGSKKLTISSVPAQVL